MLAITLVVIAATVVVRFALDERLQRFEVSRDVGRVAVAAVVVAAIVAVIAIDPVEQFDEFKAPPTGQELSSRRRRPAARRRQRPLPVLGDRGGRVRERPGRRRRRERLHALLARASRDPDPGPAGALAAVRDPGRARDRRPRAPGRPSSAPPWSPASAAPGVRTRCPRRRRRWPCSSSASRRPPSTGPGTCPPSSSRRSSPRRCSTGPATLSGPDPGPPPRGAVRNRRRFAAGVGLLLVAWVSICASGLLLLSAHALNSSREAAARGDVDGALSSANDAVDLQPWAAEPRTQLALVYEQAGDYEHARRGDRRGDQPLAGRLPAPPARRPDEGRDRRQRRGPRVACSRPTAQPARPRDPGRGQARELSAGLARRRRSCYSTSSTIGSSGRPLVEPGVAVARRGRTGGFTFASASGM